MGFIETLLENSVSKVPSNAFNEWVLTDIYLEDTYGDSQCICGHDIKEVCLIKNKRNNIELKVGNCCIVTFGFTPEGFDHVLFNGLKRIIKDRTKSPNFALIRFMIMKGKITHWEIEFLENTMKKRKLSEKQMKVRIRINNKIIKRNEPGLC